MANGGLIAQPLGSQGSFNWVFLVVILVCGILALFFLFYFNRLFATLVSYGIRAYTWHKFRAYIDITSLQISLLGGRIFFKTVTYHGHNETILVHDGHITWRYWIPQVQEADIFIKKPTASAAPLTSESSDGLNGEPRSSKDDLDHAEAGNIKPPPRLPCRISIKVSGVEAFLYNHTPAYDALVSSLRPKDDDDAKQMHTQPNDGSPSLRSTVSINSVEDVRLQAQKTVDSALGRQSVLAAVTNTSVPAYLRLFPIQIECKKAGAAVGNENSTSIVTAKAGYVTGRVDVSEAGQLDLFKLLFMFDINNVLVSLRPNNDFKMYQLQAATRAAEGKAKRRRKRRSRIPGLIPLLNFVKMLISPFRTMALRRRKSTGSIRTASLHTLDEKADQLPEVLPGHAQWHGLARYLEEADGVHHDEWEDVDYARLSTIADCTKMSMKFYWDIPGNVPLESPASADFREECCINGCAPPEYGLDLSVFGAIVNYGPWADGHRLVLQRIFFPALCATPKITEKLLPGQARLATVFKLHLCLEEEVVLRIPTREPSKDWRWQGRTATQGRSDVKEADFRKRRGRHSRRRKGNQGTSGADTRPFGWLDVKVSADSVVNYSMDMYPRPEGYRNSMSLDVKGTEIASSVNHGLLWRAGRLTIDANLSNPLRWNSLRAWVFKIACEDLELFILRDHMFLVSDLVADWTAGTPPDFFTFVPFQYSLELDFRNFRLFLNANDANLINNPSDPDDNNFLILQGQSLRAELGIPIDQYRSATSRIVFDVGADRLSLELRNPPRITLHNLLHHKQVAEIARITLTGSHTMFSEQSPELTDILQMDIGGKDFDLQLYGFLVRYFVNVKENYFGDFLHFRTTDEYQNSSNTANSPLAEEAEKYAYKQSNDLDVILGIVVERAMIRIPANLYSAESYIKADFPVACADLRITNYYLDLETNISPLTLSYFDSARAMDGTASKPQMRIEHVDLTGHRLFGLPPFEPAYVSTWDIAVGSITGDCSSAFLEHVAKVGAVFAFALDDAENALPLAQTEPIPEMTFVKVSTEPISVWFNIGKAAIGLFVDPVGVDFRNSADSLFSSRLAVRAPNLTLACVHPGAPLGHRLRGHDIAPARCLAFFQTSVDLTMVKRNADFFKERAKQQAHIRRHDVRTDRVRFLMNREALGKGVIEYSDGALVDPAAMCTPSLAQPLHSNGGQLRPASPNTSNISLSPQLPNTTADYQDPDESGDGGLPSNTAISTVHLSSAFMGPEIASNRIRVDLREVPPFSAPTWDEDDESDKSSVDSDLVRPDQDQGKEHTTIIMRLLPGVRVLVKPQVADVALDIASMLMPRKAVDIVDAFQILVMDNVAQALQQKTTAGGTLEFNLTVAGTDVRVINENEHPELQYQDHFKDQLDISFGHLNVTVRQWTAPSDSNAHSALILHMVLDSVSVQWADMLKSPQRAEGAINLDVEDAMVWMNVSDRSSVNVAFKLLTAFIDGQQCQYLASALRRSLVMVNATRDRVVALSDHAKGRVRYVTHFLTTRSDAMTDPPYISRMTHMLRAYPYHFRNQDSWKVVARFRNIFETLQPDKLKELTEKLEQGQSGSGSDKEMLNQWIEWCGWDIPNLESTQIFKMLLSQEVTAAPAQSQPRLSLALQSGVIRLLVGTGGQRSEVSLAELVMDFNVEPPMLPSGLMLQEENLRTMTTVQANSKAVLVRINWDILKLVDSVAPVLKEHVEPLLAAKAFSKDDSSSGELAHRSEYHLVLSADDGSIFLDTVNLQHVATAKNIRVSVIGTSHGGTYGQCVSTLVTAEQAVTELLGDGSRVWRTELNVPSLYVDHRKLLDRDDSSLNVGGSYELVRIVVEQEILGLLATVDKVLAEEVLQIKQMIIRLDRGGIAIDELAQDQKSKGGTLHVNAALLAGDFSVDVALLQALAFSISGKAAHLRMTPHSDDSNATHVEMDIGPMEQVIMSRERGSADRRAVFHSPPAATSVTVVPEGDIISLSITTKIEQVELEASAVQDAIAVFGRQEVQDVIGAIGEEVEELKKRVAGLQDREQQSKPKAVSPPFRFIRYNADATLAGLQILAHAPLFEARARKAELAVGFGNVRVVINNESAPTTDQLALPDVDLHVEGLGGSLFLVDGGSRKPCGHVTSEMTVRISTDKDDTQLPVSNVSANSNVIDINVFAETASVIVDLVTHAQQKLADIDLSRELDSLRRLRATRRGRAMSRVSETATGQDDEAQQPVSPDSLIASYDLTLSRIRVAWVVTEDTQSFGAAELEDLELTLLRVEFSVKHLKQAKLTIRDLQLQLVPKSSQSFDRSLNSALLPEVVFTVSHDTTPEGVKLAFQAAGKALDLRLDSRVVIAASIVESSVSVAVQKYKAASANWRVSNATATKPRTNPFGSKALVSFLFDANFAGAVVYLQGTSPKADWRASSPRTGSIAGRPDDFATVNTSLHAPGIALKVEYLNEHAKAQEPTLKVEIKVDASSNTVYPEMVPIMLQISDSVKKVMRESESGSRSPATSAAVQETTQRTATKVLEEQKQFVSDPSALLGKTQLSFGLRICKQEFGLSCQPIARVHSKVQIEDIYVTVNTTDSSKYGHFFAASAALTKFSASVQHAYSRESSFSFDVESIVLSIMNSKHLSRGSSGVSAILRVNPTKTSLNVKQLQDLLLFREIWMPEELRRSQTEEVASPEDQPDEFLVQRYQLVTSAAAFPWNATLAIVDLSLDLDLGQSIGRSSFLVENLWASTQKSSSWKQDLCVGVGEISVNSTGRMSGFIELSELNARTSIEWPPEGSGARQAPRIQASAGFEKLRAKAAFDYQPFAFTDIETFGFMMYNVREERTGSADRLVATLDGGKVFAFCTSTSPAQAVGLVQAFERLVQEKQLAYKSSVADLEKHLHRTSIAQPQTAQLLRASVHSLTKDTNKLPISLHTDVNVVLRSICIGAFPGTFFDPQVLKMEATNVQARFAVGLEKSSIHSDLGMTLGQLQVALATVKRVNVPKTLGDITIDEVIANATLSKGGVILRVPKVNAAMQTWQTPDNRNNNIDYIFKSLFEGKVDVGWNYSRISFIRGMWSTHTRSLASRLGKALPEAAVKITTVPEEDEHAEQAEPAEPRTNAQGKITAVVNLPSSRYEYRALEPPIIETPQLRDMGEATPPLEWIGLHRDRLPNVTHQIVIVTLLEVAKEVEDAYGRILGSS